MLEETADEAFNVYMTRKTQGWFLRWGCPRPSDAAASPGPGVAPGCAGIGARAATPAHPPAPAASDDEKASDLITWGGCDDQAPSPTLDLETLLTRGLAQGTRQDFKTSASSSHWPRSTVQEGISTLEGSRRPQKSIQKSIFSPRFFCNSGSSLIKVFGRIFGIP